jgi:hypothetical protein
MVGAGAHSMEHRPILRASIHAARPHRSSELRCTRASQDHAVDYARAGNRPEVVGHQDARSGGGECLGRCQLGELAQRCSVSRRSAVECVYLCAGRHRFVDVLGIRRGPGGLNAALRSSCNGTGDRRLRPQHVADPPCGRSCFSTDWNRVRRIGPLTSASMRPGASRVTHDRSGWVDPPAGVQARINLPVGSCNRACPQNRCWLVDRAGAEEPPALRMGLQTSPNRRLIRQMPQGEASSLHSRATQFEQSASIAVGDCRPATPYPGG